MNPKEIGMPLNGLDHRDSRRNTGAAHFNELVSLPLND